MPIQIDVQVEGIIDAINVIGQVLLITDPDLVADQGAAILLARIRARYLAETDPDGVPWQPSEAGKRRKAEGRGGGTLFDTGTLFQSIQAFRQNTGVRSIGTDVPYAAVHQFGLEGQVQRMFLGFSIEDTLLIERLLVARLNAV